MGTVFSRGSSSDLAGGADTICALATAVGAGALAIVRVSGPGVGPVLRCVCPRLQLEEPWVARRIRVVDRTGSVIDDGIGVAYRGPRSYTGEDMAELTVHAGPAGVRQVLERLVECGCRLAEPGEFTRRAVANGKMDLVQAQGLVSLLAAESGAQQRAARAQMAGALSGRLGSVRQELIKALGAVEGVIDLGEVLSTEEKATVGAAVRRARDVLDEYRRGVEHGQVSGRRYRVVIAGEANSGKSTLLNGLVGEERAIVAEGGGTTRDPVECLVELAGVPVLLVDTAGLRTGGDPVEREGMRRSVAAIGSADLVVEVRSAESWRRQEVPVPEGCERLLVWSKIDRVRQEEFPGGVAAVLTSPAGVQRVRDALEERLTRVRGWMEDGLSATRRQAAAAQRAWAELAGCEDLEVELLAEGLRGAAKELGRVFGEIDGEEVLGEVFAQFCVGK